MNTIIEKISDPLKFYKHPEEVEKDNTLSVDDKIKLLNNWINDIQLRQIAEEENMIADTQPRYYMADVERLLRKYQGEKGQE